MGGQAMNGWWWNRTWQRITDPYRLRWFPKVWVAFALLFALVHHSLIIPAHAQHRDIVIGDAELAISYAIDGSATISFNQWFETSPPQVLPQKLALTIERLSNRCEAQWGAPYNDEYSFNHYLSCDRSARPSGLVQRSELDLQPLLKLLQDSGTRTLDISIEIPSDLPFHSLPTFFQPPVEGGWLGSGSARFSSSIDLASIDINREELMQSQLAALPIEYGYQVQDLQRMMLPLVTIGLLAPLLTAVGRRRALRRMQANGKTAGFQFQQYHAVSILFIWGGWTLSLLGMQWGYLLDLATASWVGWLQSVVGFIGITAFPTAICLLCRWIAYPVIAQVGRVRPLLRKVLLEGAIEQGLIAEAFAVYIAVPAFLAGEIRLAIIWCVGAAASAFALKLAQAQISGLIPQSVTVGPLRDRVFELALAAEVEIKQLYVLPTRKTQVANAFAVSGGMVMLTDYLLENLTKREVDAVIAHELTHFERKHHASQGTLMTGAIVLIFLGTLWNAASHFALFFTLSILALGGAFAAQMYQSRRHEYEADWGAAKLTGDPEAMISALAAITDLAEMPALWNPLAEALGTHPSLQNRANAIANAYHIPAERVEQLLLTPDPHRDSYSISSEASDARTVYSSEVKSHNALKAVVLLSGTAAIVSAAVASWFSVFFPSLSYVPIAFCTIASFVALLWVDSRVAQLGMKTLGSQLRQKFKKQGLAVEDRSGVLVGFSPSLQPQLYEGTLFWDTGLLYLGPDRLAYVGEQTQFSLPVEAVSYVGYSKLRFEWFRLILIQIQWCNSEGDTESGYLGIREGNTATDLKRTARQWFERLQQWTDGKNSDSALPAKLQELPLPSIGTVTSAPLKTLKSSLKLLWITVLPASALLSVILGLSALNGFYVCVSACLAFFALQFPILLFTGTDAAAVTPSHPQPPPSSHQPSTPTETSSVSAGEGDFESV